MSALSEFALTLHRIAWYPLHRALGLEGPPVGVPEHDVPALVAAEALNEDGGRVR